MPLRCYWTYLGRNCHHVGALRARPCRFTPEWQLNGNLAASTFWTANIERMRVPVQVNEPAARVCKTQPSPSVVVQSLRRYARTIVAEADLHRVAHPRSRQNDQPRTRSLCD